MENITPKQQHILNTVDAYKDANNECVVNIHLDLHYPLTPESINPAIRDFEKLKEGKSIESYERVSSRVFKITTK